MKTSEVKRAGEVLKRLGAKYPAPKPALIHRDAWTLLVATVLSAQCTDERVNQVTPELFRRWPGPGELASAGLAEIEAVVRPTGFFRNKAKNLKSAAAIVMERFNGRVPGSMAELTTLPGVARKTANIVLSNAFGRHEGIAVDTHVARLSRRLGLTHSDKPAVIEKDLMALLPQKHWGDINHYLVFFGRERCPARKPRCAACEISDLCPRIGVDS